MTRFLIAAALLAGAAVSASSPWVIQASPTTERLRGVSASSDTVAWASGNKGTVVRTIDGGATWARRAPCRTRDALDFRDIEAFGAGHRLRARHRPRRQVAHLQDRRRRAARGRCSSRTWIRARSTTPSRSGTRRPGLRSAIRSTAGSPSSAPLTAAAPGRAFLPPNIPEALPGDGAFAASGTCLVVHGYAPRLVRHRRRRSRARLPLDRPGPHLGRGRHAHHGRQRLVRRLLAGVQRSGTRHRRRRRLPARRRESGDNLALTTDGGRTWAFAGATRLRSFRSAVAYVPGSKGQRLIAAGPGGTDVSERRRSLRGRRLATRASTRSASRRPAAPRGPSEKADGSRRLLMDAMTADADQHVPPDPEEDEKEERTQDRSEHRGIEARDEDTTSRVACHNNPGGRACRRALDATGRRRPLQATDRHQGRRRRRLGLPGR